MADAQIPDKPALEGLEQKWDAAWRDRGTYLFDRDAARAKGRFFFKQKTAYEI